MTVGWWVAKDPLAQKALAPMAQMMENQLTTLSADRLAAKALDWWCPDRAGENQAKLTELLSKALSAARERDWSSYWTELNGAAVGVLGYDTVDEEEAVLGRLDDLCRGHLDHEG
jgi:hypothetical protein